jgi:rhamnosyltransferase
MKRLAVFVHFDRDGIIDPYVEFYLQRLSEVTDDIVFVTTSSLNTTNLEKLESLCTKIICRENVGYDFMSYKVGLAAYERNEYDEVVICNDSVYGPFSPLGELMERMSSEACDYWGMSESFQFSHHLQSYFIVFKKKALLSDVFRTFWDGVKVINSKADLILAYEIGLSTQFQKGGLKQGVACRIENEKKEALKKALSFLIRGKYKKARNVYKRCHDGGSFACNTTLLFWDVLMSKYSMPFLKIAVLSHNAFGCKQTDSYQKLIVQQSNYPVELIVQHQKRMRR